MAKPTVFIDGEAGTTGLQIRDRLSTRTDLELVSIDPGQRKDSQTRSQLLNAVDVAILCLPDDAAREAVSWINNPAVKILDASTAHRTAPDWVYGFPELEPGRRDRIAAARRVSNPGCYPTGFLACIRPLVSAGLIPKHYPVTVNAVSGYSGGGRKLIDSYRAARNERAEGYPYGIYGVDLGHKHVSEMQLYAGLEHPPLFIPSVSNVEQGMLVQIPLPLWTLEYPPSGAELQAALADYYRDEPFVEVAPLGDVEALREGKFLDIDAVNGTNCVQVFVFASDERGEALLVARLDNLGKGASGAAVQNLNLMLGLPEQSEILQVVSENGSRSPTGTLPTKLSRSG
ncbi:N-acetyl-gamma-glutamyl-phosphate reductase [Synechococcus sp. PCC 7336]|uniref:N-acetyl-gamma-glutamyl-phosphate reductase n=1 Tax=Synechococcus sp. PCC 7336 TaxID=195250 RepID=UPI00034D8236|nr:N-acetyl-gamma-glutamyl-phosphate reductase [Synechococcus sp. PCC 7336]